MSTGTRPNVLTWKQEVPTGQPTIGVQCEDCGEGLGAYSDDPTIIKAAADAHAQTRHEVKEAKALVKVKGPDNAHKRVEAARRAARRATA